METRRYVHTYILEGFPDDTLSTAQEIWERPTPFMRDKQRLAGILRRHPLGVRKTLPAHVRIDLPEALYEHIRRTTGQKELELLAAQLKTLHENDYGAWLDDKKACYAIRADKNLHPGTLRVSFGPGVHIPDPDQEHPSWNISWSCDGADWQHANLFNGQRLLTLGGDETASEPTHNWPFGSRQVVITMEVGAKALNLTAEPLGSLEIEQDLHKDAYRIHSADSADTSPVFLRTKFLPPPETATKNRKFSPGENPLQPPLSPCLQLIAIALPDLQRYRQNSLAKTFRFSLLPDGMPQDATSVAAPEAGITIQVDTSGIHLQDKDACHLIPLETSIPAFPHVRLHRPPAGVEGYTAIYPLPHPTTVAFPNQALIFGRKPYQKPDEDFLLPLRILATPTNHGGAEQFALSRRHCQLEATPRGLRVTPLGMGSLHHLDTHCQLLTPNGPEKQANLLIQDGEHLLIGPYLLRFSCA